MPPAVTPTGLSITNPLVLYRALLSTKRIDPDPAQHRLAIHLQKLYERLKDYEPVIQYGHRLQQISNTLGSTPGRPHPGTGHDVPRGGSPPEGIFSSIFKKEPEARQEGMALTRVLTSQEAAMSMDSPKGLMLHGEVGTGKSMLIDLFADCLPNRKKKRWHYTSFMLHTIHKLEQLRRSRQLIIPSSLGQGDDYSLLWLAREMISTSPILFLDEFQLPDRAAAKIMTNLMTCFFHLGGVLIATSNRMPEELAKAAGLDFVQPAPNRLEALGWSFGLGGGRRPTEKKSDFAKFLDVLDARCEVWQMEGQQDYRRREAERDAAATGEQANQVEQTLGDQSAHHSFGSASDASTLNAESDASSGTVLPRYFFVQPQASESVADDQARFQSDLSSAIASATSTTAFDGIPWGSTTLSIYGRSVPVPRHYSGVTYWTFDELCTSALGPADYITLASTFHTVIVTDVPALSLLQKNEARRLITLLDALYEARCKLIISAAAGPDDIFFPEAGKPGSKDEANETVDQDQILPETFSEVYQDATAPFRPNVSSYAQDPGIMPPEEADSTHARFAGMLRDEQRPPPDQLEDGPPNSLSAARTAQVYGLDTGDGMENRHPTSPALSASLETPTGTPAPSGPDFQRASIFTGEDERFAYKRARSRLWEMCGARWHARTGDDSAATAAAAGADAPSGAADTSWWKPVDPAARSWERPLSASTTAPSPTPTTSADAPAAAREGAGAAAPLNEEADSVLFRHGASPFRGSPEAPPKFSMQHFWGTVRWGRKAGRWGQGAEAFEQGAEARAERESGADYVKRRDEWRKREPKDPRRAFGLENEDKSGKP